MGTEHGRTMKILAFTPTYLPFMGGIEVLVDLLAGELRKRSVETIVLADSYGKPSHKSEFNGTTVHRVSMIGAILARNAARPLAALSYIRGVYEAVQPDIIHLHSATQAGAFFLERLLMSLPRKPPVIVTQHGVLIASDELGVTHRMLNKADVLTGVTNAVLRSAIDFSGRTGRCEMIYNGIASLMPAVAGRREMPARHSLLGVGRMQSEKGFDIAIAALARLRARGINVELQLIGRGEDETSLAALATGLGVASHVRFRGVLENAATRRAIGSSTLLLVPSRTREGFGLVAAEAALAGTPCIASRVGGLPEVVEDEVTGRLVPEDDAEALADAAEGLLRNPDEWQRLSDNALKRAPERFALDRCVENYMRLYSSLL